MNDKNESPSPELQTLLDYREARVDLDRIENVQSGIERAEQTDAILSHIFVVAALAAAQLPWSIAGWGVGYLIFAFWRARQYRRQVDEIRQRREAREARAAARAAAQVRDDAPGA